MNYEEARLYLEHTSKDDFNLEEHQKENRYQAIQVVLKEIERLNNIIEDFEKYLRGMFNGTQDTKYLDDLQKVQELKGVDKE